MTHAWRPMWGYYRLMLRVTRVNWFIHVFMGVIVPVLVYVIYAQRLPAEAKTRLLVGNVLFSALTMIGRNPAMDMVYHRVTNRQALLATTSVTRPVYLLATGLYALTLAVLPLAVLAACLAISTVRPPVSWSWTVPFALAVFCLVGTAYCLGTIPKSLPTSGLLGNLLVAGSIAFCPLLYPLERVPRLIRPAVELLPPTLSAETMTAAWRGEPTAPWHLALLALWGFALGAYGWRAFPWGDGRA